MRPKIFTAHERKIRARVAHEIWRRANSDILNLKKRYRYATDAVFRDKCKAKTRARLRRAVALKEAA